MKQQMRFWEAERLSLERSIEPINLEENIRILQLLSANTWPEGWTGKEPRADALLSQAVADGVMQPLLAEEGETRVTAGEVRR